MAKFRVWAKSISYVYVDIEAENEDDAFDYANEKIDGGDFHENGGDWELMDDVLKLDDDADVDFVVDEEEE